MAQPKSRIQYYDKEEKQAYDCGAVFQNDRHDWKDDLVPEKSASSEGKFKRMLLSEAAKRCEQKLGYLSIVKAKQTGSAPSGNRRGGSSDGDDFGGSDIPFRQRDRKVQS